MFWLPMMNCSSLCRFGIFATACAVLPTLALSQAPAPPAPASGPANAPAAPADPNQLALQGSDLFNQGKYAEAITAFEKFLKDNAGSGLESDVKSRLAYAYLMNQQNDKAITVLKQVLDTKNVPPEVAEMATSLLPDAYAAKASAMKPEDPAREKTYQEAIAGYDNFMTKYPQAKESLEAVLYGRASACFQIKDYVDAAKTLTKFLQDYPNSEQAAEAQFLLAVAYSSAASELLQGKPDDAQKAEAVKKLLQTEQILQDIITKKSDLALVNDALFQLGETFYLHAQVVPPDEKLTLMQKAKESFGQVQPKDVILEAQQARIDQIKAYRVQVAGNPALDSATKTREFARINKILPRQEAKLAQIKERDTPTLAAQIRMGEILFQDGKYDEVRVLFSYLLPNSTTEQEKKSLSFHIAMSYALQAIAGKGDKSLADRAVKAYEDFKAKYYQGDKANPTADNLPIIIGVIFLNAPNEDPEKTVKYIKEGLSLYPNGRFMALALQQLSEAYRRLGKNDDATGVIKEILQSNKSPEVAAPSKLSLMGMYEEQKKYKEAVEIGREILRDFPDRPEAERAWFTLVTILGNTDQAAAVTEAKAFIAKYPESELTPVALRILGNSLRKTDPAGASAAFRQVVEKYPTSADASSAYFSLLAIAHDAKNNPEMISLMEEFIQKRPNDPRIGDAYFALVRAIEANKPADAAKNAQSDQAIAKYLEFVEKYPQNEKAPDALLNIIRIREKILKGLGGFSGISDPAKQQQWEEVTKAIISDSENLITNYQDSDEVASALVAIVNVQRALISAKKMTPDESVAYFDKLREKFPSNNGLRSKISFTFARSIMSSDPKRAIAIMKAVYDPQLKYSTMDLDTYASALLKGGEADNALKVYEKLLADFPPGKGAPKTWPKEIQDAQLGGIVGKAKISFLKGDDAGTDALLAKFADIQKELARSGRQSEVNLILLERASKKGDKAEVLRIAQELARDSAAPPEVKARGMFVASEIWESEGKIKEAADNYLKIPAFYGSVVDIASEAMYRGAQLLEKIAPNEANPETKKAIIARTRKAYELILENYGATPWANPARERLSVLPK